MGNWTRDDWENLVAGILGFLLIIAILIGLVVLLGSIDWPTDGEPNDPNAIRRILSRS